MSVHLSKKFVFVHIPKTAGTSIERVLDMHKDYSDNNPFMGGGFYGHEPQHYSYEITLKQLEDEFNVENPETWFSFTFVRNPYDRMVSEYFWRLRVPKFQDNVGSFEDFCYWVKDQVENGSEMSHEKPMVSFGDPDDFDFVGKYENLREDFRTLCKKIGYEDRKLICTNRSFKRNREFRFYYNRELKELVYETFKEDFETFGYDPEL